jgi:type I restriction enzyme R subunit
VWTEVQQKWLKRIEEQLLREVVVDRASIDEEPFRADADINEELWKKSA